MSKLLKTLKNFFRTSNPKHKIDDALRKSLEDSFANSLYFSFKSMDITKNGFSLTLDYKKDVPAIKKDSLAETPNKSFLDYLPQSYNAYKRIYQSLCDYVINFERCIIDKYDNIINNLERSLEKTFNPDLAYSWEIK